MNLLKISSVLLIMIIFQSCSNDSDPLSGCTCRASANFNSDAVIDDGTCRGCTDSTADNYNPCADVSDGNCLITVLGCTDPTAFNYNPNASSDDGSCVPVIEGCTDSNAFNYNPEANTDDGSCIAVVEGCTDPAAINYNPEANTDDGNCDYLVAYYPFNGNANDESGNGNNGNVNGPSLTYDRHGNSNSAYYFDGIDDNISIPRSIEDNFTISFWIKSTQNDGNSERWYWSNGLVDAEVSNVTNDFGISMGNGLAVFGVGNPDTHVNSAGNLLNDNGWHMITATRNISDGLMKLFIDGELVNSGTGSTNSLTAPSSISIGSLQTQINFYQGYIDDIRIYPVILDSDQVTDLYMTEVPEEPESVNVGDYAYGGIVAYVYDSNDPGYDANAQHGIIVSHLNQSSSATWGCSGSSISGADDNGIGTGLQNTLDIINGCSDTGIAAKLCTDLNINGYYDWHLPSRDELIEIWDNRNSINTSASSNGGSPLSSDYYWSSTETSSDLAWTVHMGIGGTGFLENREKWRSSSVRAIRYF